MQEQYYNYLSFLLFPLLFQLFSDFLIFFSSSLKNNIAMSHIKSYLNIVTMFKLSQLQPLTWEN